MADPQPTRVSAPFSNDVMGQGFMVHMHAHMDDSDVDTYAQVNRKAHEQMQVEMEKRLNHAQAIDKTRIVELLHARGHTICGKAYKRCGVLGEKIVQAFHEAIASAVKAAPQGSEVTVQCTAQDYRFILVATRGTGVRTLTYTYHNMIMVTTDPDHGNRLPPCWNVTQARQKKRAGMASMNLTNDEGDNEDLFVRFIVADYINMATGDAEGRKFPWAPMPMDAVRTMLRDHCIVHIRSTTPGNATWLEPLFPNSLPTTPPSLNA